MIRRSAAEIALPLAKIAVSRFPESLREDALSHAWSAICSMIESDPQTPAAYLVTSGRNAAIDGLRKETGSGRKRPEIVSIDALREWENSDWHDKIQDPNAVPAFVPLSRAEQLAGMAASINALEEADRELALSVYFSGGKVPDLAREMGLSEAEVYARLGKIRLKLREAVAA